jgi:hypothetical protein
MALEHAPGVAIRAAVNILEVLWNLLGERTQKWLL